MNLNAHDKIRYLLTADNNKTSENFSRQIYESCVQKEKRITESAILFCVYHYSRYCYFIVGRPIPPNGE